MKFNKYIAATALCNISVVKAADFFAGVERAEIFNKIELNMPTFRINLSDEAYNRFKLTYQCLYDTHPNYESLNEDCYKAPWAKYNEIASALLQDGIIDTSLLTFEQQNQLSNPELTYEDFSSIISTASSLTMQDIFSQRKTYVSIPAYEEKHASIDFILNGYVLLKKNNNFLLNIIYFQKNEKSIYIIIFILLIVKLLLRKTLNFLLVVNTLKYLKNLNTMSILRMVIYLEENNLDYVLKLLIQVFFVQNLVLI